MRNRQLYADTFRLSFLAKRSGSGNGEACLKKNRHIKREEFISYGKQWSFVLLYRKIDNILYVKIQKNSNLSRKDTILSHIEKDKLPGKMKQQYR